MKKICGKCGIENKEENLICQNCGHELNKDLKPQNFTAQINNSIKQEDKTDFVIIKESKNPYAEKYECSKIFGILSIIAGSLSILSFILLFIDFWYTPLSFALSISSLYFAKMQAKRCYERLAIFGKGLGIISFSILFVSLLVYLIFYSVMNLFL